MLMMSCSSIHTKLHSEKHVIITTIIIAFAHFTTGNEHDDLPLNLKAIASNNPYQQQDQLAFLITQVKLITTLDEKQTK